MIRAIDPPRFRQQILTRQDGACLLELHAQGIVKSLAGYAPQRDEVFADAATRHLLARQCGVDVGAGNEASGQQ
jgi:hypothetical protein